MLAMLVLGLQSHYIYCQVSSLYYEVSPISFLSLYLLWKNSSPTLSRKETFQSKQQVCPSLPGTHTALVCADKHKGDLQWSQFEALFLLLKWQTLTAHPAEEETGLQHASLFTTAQIKPSSRHKAGCCLRQHSCDTSDIFLPPAELQKGWTLLLGA